MKQLFSYRHILFAIPFSVSTVVYCVNNTEYLFKYKLLFSIILAVIFLNNILAGIRVTYARKLRKPMFESSQDIPNGLLSESNSKKYTIINLILYLSATWLINFLVFSIAVVFLGLSVFFEFHRLKKSIRDFLSTYWPSIMPIAIWLLITRSFDWISTLLSVTIMLTTAGYTLMYPDHNPHNPTQKHFKTAMFFHILAFSVACSIPIINHAGFAGWFATILFGLTLSTFHLHDKYLLSAQSKVLSFFAYILSALVFSAFWIIEWTH